MMETEETVTPRRGSAGEGVRDSDRDRDRDGVGDGVRATRPSPLQ